MVYETELYHYGIKGQKWGVRRYQNPDGTLTAAGKKQRRKNEGYKRAAKTILKQEAAYADRTAKRINRKLGRLDKKLDKYQSKMDKFHDKGVLDKRDRYLDKYFDTFDKMEEYTSRHDSLMEKSKFYKRKLSEIENDVLEAGKDYVARYVEYYDGVYYIKDAKLEFLTEKGRS